jgi:hypothetical protein
MEEECSFRISYSDFMIIMMGCGVGYFFTGYLITNIVHYVHKRRNPQEVLIADHVV